MPEPTCEAGLAAMSIRFNTCLDHLDGYRHTEVIRCAEKHMTTVGSQQNWQGIDCAIIELPEPSIGTALGFLLGMFALTWLIRWAAEVKGKED